MPLDNRDSRAMAISNLAKVIESLTHSTVEFFDEDLASKQLAAAIDLVGLGARVTSHLANSNPAPGPSSRRQKR